MRLKNFWYYLPLLLLISCHSDNDNQQSSTRPLEPVITNSVDCEAKRDRIWFDDSKQCRAFKDMDMPSLNLMSQDQDLIFNVQKVLMLAKHDIEKDFTNLVKLTHLTIFDKPTVVTPVAIDGKIMFVNPKVPSQSEMETALLGQGVLDSKSSITYQSLDVDLKEILKVKALITPDLFGKKTIQVTSHLDKEYEINKEGNILVIKINSTVISSDAVKEIAKEIL